MPDELDKTTHEQAIIFPCQGDQLVGIVHKSSSSGKRGVLIVVGGPQYRAGSHRQFVLLARFLAQSGIPVFRFDYRGMGDSGGSSRTFEEIDDDISAAIDEFYIQVPILKEVVIWGLCDAASAALFYAQQDRRITGLVLLNPWVRNETTLAKTYIRNYYFKRIFSADFWHSIRSGKFNFSETVKSFYDNLIIAFGFKHKLHNQPASNKKDQYMDSKTTHSTDFPARMREGLKQFSGNILLVLSENDFVATEFKNVVKNSRAWRNLLKRSTVTRLDIAQATHTFSRSDWRDQVANATKDWMAQW